MTENDSGFPQLQLKKHEDQRIRKGHPWVYSNEVNIQSTPLKAFEPGQQVEILDASGKALGTGYVNPHSLICARIVSRNRRYPFSVSLLVHRLRVALGMREKLYSVPNYRLVHGEGDQLPGLVIDRYGDILVVQTTTAGMEAILDDLIDAINKVLKPAVIILRNEGPLRALEGLESYTEVIQGYAESVKFLQVQEGQGKFQAPLLDGQKTGWFYDQQDNRRELKRLAKNSDMLDVCSYVGGWGIQAALHGAASVTCVDESVKAGEFVLKNAELNKLDNIEFIRGDAFATLKSLQQHDKQFDLIVVDPPAFIKRRKDLKKGIEAYRRINQLAMQLLTRDGYLIACSCSYHLSRDQLLQQLQAGARHLNKNLQVLGYGQQSADHPIHPMIPETAYLKAIYSRITPA